MMKLYISFITYYRTISMISYRLVEPNINLVFRESIITSEEKESLFIEFTLWSSMPHH